MTGYIVNVFPSRNRVSSPEAFEGLELGEGKLSRPVLRGPGGRKAAWPLDNLEIPLGRVCCLDVAARRQTLRMSERSSDCPMVLI